MARVTTKPLPRSDHWEPDAVRVRLRDGSIVPAWICNRPANSAGQQPRPRFQHGGRWWCVPLTEVLQ